MSAVIVIQWFNITKLKGVRGWGWTQYINIILIFNKIQIEIKSREKDNFNIQVGLHDR